MVTKKEKNCEDDELDGEFADGEPEDEEEAYSPGAEEELLSSGEACGSLEDHGNWQKGKSKRLWRRNKREFYRVLMLQRWMIETRVFLIFGIVFYSI